jgi:HAD superfamily phosphoserine phosphatase-like hydrolase
LHTVVEKYYSIQGAYNMINTYKARDTIISEVRFIQIRKYALFDWDNTLHDGFTILAWMEYLCSKNIIDEKYYSEILFQMKLYSEHRLSYDELCNNTASIYANSVSGIELSLLDNIAYDFCCNNKAILPFVKNMFYNFRKNNIDTIVVSGAPQILLSQYSKLLGISKAYGMHLEVRHNRFTGNVEQNYGTDKTNIVKEIMLKKKGKPVFALGDSKADSPLIEAAKFGYYVEIKSNSLKLGNTVIATLSSFNSFIKSLGFLQK